MGTKRIALRTYYANKKIQDQSTNDKHASVLKRKKNNVRSKDKLLTDDIMIRESKSDCNLDWKSIERAQNLHHGKLYQNAIGEGNDERDGDDDDDDDSDDDDNDDGMIELDGNIEQSMEDYTFEFNDMKVNYVEGICTMLRTRSFIANPTEAYNLALLIVSQTIVGTVVNSEAEQDSFAFATILSIEKCHRNIAVREILSSLRQSVSHLRPCKDLELLMNCIDGCHSAASGMLIHRRFFNLPLQLIGALHENLVDDLTWAKQQPVDDDDSENLLPAPTGSSNYHVSKHSNFFANLQYVLLLCEGKVTGPGKTSSQIPRDGSCDLIASGLKNSVTFNYFEDEVYMQHASTAVLFRPTRQHSSVDTLICIVVPASKLSICMESIKRLV